MKWNYITTGLPIDNDIIECIVKLKSGNIVRLNYNHDLKLWYYPSTNETQSAIKKDCNDIIAWIDCKDLDKILIENP